MPINSLQNYCAICARIATIGSEKAFDIDQETVTKQIHQISQEKWVEYMLYYPEYHEKEKKIKIENEIKFYLSNELFQEMLSGIMLCFSRSQDLINSAKLSLSLIHYRAVYDLIPEVLLTTNSMMKISENI
ncbi:hypothetical protein M0811_10308 [Anaeramoeba ignava]|nr:hypothetical protein M0811_10308 [Anaeramoeba ignava]